MDALDEILFLNLILPFDSSLYPKIFSSDE